MRLWMDDQERMLTDEQLLRQIAHYGSLKDSLEHGDVRLVSNSGDNGRPSRKNSPVPERRLADYL